MSFTTADLCDEYGERVQVLQESLKFYGGEVSFCGEIVTVQLNEDNSALVSLLRDTKGEGRVVVVQVEGERCAVVGDNLMRFAEQNGWAGIVIDGYVRDTKITPSFSVGLLARGTCPRKSPKISKHTMGVDITFFGVVFREGDYLYADEDGVIVATSKLL